MAERNPPAYLSAGDYNASDDRTALAALLGADSALTPRGGVIPAEVAGPLKVTQSGGGMAVSVAAGQAAVPSTEGGAYLVTNDAARVLALDPSDVSSPRIDRVVAQVYDTDAGDGSDVWALEVIPGTPAGVPAAPAEPSNAVSLATVLVPAGSTGAGLVLTDVRRKATGLGNTGLHTPRGVVAMVVTGTSAVGSVEARVDPAVVFTFEAGRIYRVLWQPHTIDGESGGGWDTSYTSQSSARLYLRYAIGADPTPASPQTHFGGLARVAVFGEDSAKCGSGMVSGYLHDLADGAEVHVAGMLVSEVAGHIVRANPGVLEVSDCGAWPTIWPQS